MGWKWSEFSSSDQQKMEVGISEDTINSDLVNIASYLNGFLVLDYQLSLCQGIKDSIFIGLTRRKADHRDSRQLANIICSFGKLDVVWSELPREAQDWCYNGIELCCASFDSRDISNLILGCE
jgi:hypothetical protein